jgi:hypothetical protein
VGHVGPYVVHIVPLGQPQTDTAPSRALVIVIDPARDRSPSPLVLRQLYGLTTAEANVAAAILPGHGLSSVCRRAVPVCHDGKKSSTADLCKPERAARPSGSAQHGLSHHVPNLPVSGRSLMFRRAVCATTRTCRARTVISRNTMCYNAIQIFEIRSLDRVARIMVRRMVVVR